MEEKGRELGGFLTPWRGCRGFLLSGKASDRVIRGFFDPLPGFAGEGAPALSRRREVACGWHGSPAPQQGERETYPWTRRTSSEFTFSSSGMSR